jgi:hypothetical protein
MPANVCQDVIDLIVSFRIRRGLILFNDYLDVGPLYFDNYNFGCGKFYPRFLTGNFTIQANGKIKIKMRGRRPEGHITDPRNSRIVETNRRQRRMEVSFEGGQGPEWAVAP